VPERHPTGMTHSTACYFLSTVCSFITKSDAQIGHETPTTDKAVVL
jgi:hypothetical protein